MNKKINIANNPKTQDERYSHDSKGYLSLKDKYFIISAIVICIYFISQYSFYHLNIFHKISNEEKIFSEKTMSTILNAIKYNNEGVTTFNRDWAEWDAMYNAVDNWTKEFEEENVPESVLVDQSFNYMVITNKNGDVLYSKSYIPNISDKVQNFTLDTETRKILFNSKNNNFNGILTYNGIPVYFSSMAILHTDATGPVNGHLIMARILNEDFIKEIGLLLNEKISFLEKNYPCNCSENGPCIILTKKDNTMTLIFPLLNFFNEKVGYINVSIKRNLFQIISKSTKLFFILSMGIFLILISSFFYLLNTLTLKKLKSMSLKLNSIKTGDNLFTPFEVSGNDEITILQKSFNSLIKRIQKEEEYNRKMEKNIVAMEKMATAGKITYNILHEINNPIRVIKNYLFALENNNNNFNHSYLNSIKDEINHLSNITNQLLDFSRNEKPILDIIYIEDIINETVKTIKIAFPDDGYKVNIDCKYSKAKIKGNSGKLKQVFFNILKNAVEAINFTGEVKISIEVENEMVVVKISDNGPGISGIQIEKLFEPFYTKDKKDGVGLGLSISYNIIKNHGGDIFIDANVESGACFIIVLPKYTNGVLNE